MKTLIPEAGLSSLDDYKPAYILTDWLEAMTNFHTYYHQLTTCVSQKLIEEDLRLRTTTYIGQCPVSQLVKLVSSMQRELKKLAQDIEQPAVYRQSTITKHYKKLAVHTRILNHLNQQAQTRLELIRRSVS